jgi:Concanavalin A-like lectin/glucanases superfamily
MAYGFGVTYGSGGVDTDTIITNSCVQTPILFSIAGWQLNLHVEDAALGKFPRVFNKNNGVNDLVQWAWQGDIDQYLFQLQYATGPAFTHWVGENNPGVWSHTVITWDTSNLITGPIIYTNGAVDTSGLGFDASGTAGGPLTDDAISPYAIGCRPVLGLRGFDGRIAEVAMWDTILTPREVLSLANRTFKPWQIRPWNLLSYFPLDGYQHPGLNMAAAYARTNIAERENDNSQLVFKSAKLAVGPVSQHPKQILGPSFPLLLGPRILPIPVSYVYQRPDADNTDGGWTRETGSNVNLFQSIDETVIDDADYIISQAKPVNDLCKISLSDTSGTKPASVRYRYGKRGSGQVDITVQLLEGTTVIKSWTHTDVSETLTTVTQALADAEFDSITDLNNLFLSFKANAP